MPPSTQRKSDAGRHTHTHSLFKHTKLYLNQQKVSKRSEQSGWMWINRCTFTQSVRFINYFTVIYIKTTATTSDVTDGSCVGIRTLCGRGKVAPKERCLTGCKQQTLSNTAWTWTDIYYFTQLQHVLLSAPFCSGSLK